MIRNILLGLAAFAALLSILIFSGRIPIGSKTSSGATGTVVMWGTLPQDQIENVLQGANKAAKTYRVDYQEVSEDVFSSKLLNALASGTGPDLILAPYQIILENRDRVFPFPPASLSLTQFRNAYIDGAALLYQENGALGLPVSVEPLMLFANRTLLSKHGVINPPATWDQVSDMMPRLTIPADSGRFLESGIALGAANNITATKDILMTLIEQLAQTPVQRVLIDGKETFNILADTPINSDSEVRPLSTAVRFFTQFSDPTKTTYSWNSIQPAALDQFVAEKLALYVGYLGDAATIRAKNNRLDLSVSMLPQAKGYTTSLTGMKMYAIATLRRTTNPTTALTAEGALTGVPYGPTIASLAGGVTPIKSALAQDPSVSGEVRQSVLVAQGWFDSHGATSESYVEAMINDVVSGRSSIGDAADLFVSRMSELYTK